MKLLLSSIVSVLILLLIVFLTRLTVTIHLQKNGRDDRINVKVEAWFRLIQIMADIPIVRLAEDLNGTEYRVEMKKNKKRNMVETDLKVTRGELKTSFDRLKQLFYSVNDLHIILKHVLKSVRLMKLEWRTKIGTDDAAETGVLVGIGWSVKTVILRLLQRYLTVCTIPTIDVTPSFQQACLEIDFSCMIRFRIGNAIIAGIRMLKNLQRRRDTKWQNTQFKA